MKKNIQCKKTYLITGSCGFIGYSLAKRLLALGNTVIGIDICNDYYDVKMKMERNKILKSYKSYTFYKADICNLIKLESIVRAHPIDVIVHLAAQAGVRYSFEYPLTYLKNNIDGTVYIFEVARLCSIKTVIYASSSSVYGDALPPHHEIESDTDSPISMYAATKKATELCAHAYAHSYDMTIIGLRFFTVYGPWSRPDMAMLKFVKAIELGKPISLYGNGKLKRSFTYIDDIVDGIVSATEIKSGNHIINIGGGESIEVRQLVKLLEYGLNKKAITINTPIPRGDVKETFASQTLARKKLHFKPRVTFEEGVKLFCTWFLDHKEFVLSLKEPKQ